MSQSQLQKERSERRQEDWDVEHVDYKPSNSKASEVIDDLLDAIDDVLEENAEEFVAAYQQRGGQ